MNDTKIIQGFTLLQQSIQQIDNSLRTAIAGHTLQIQALYNLLVKKGIITNVEMTQALEDVLSDLESNEEVNENTGLITPTVAQAKEITNESK